MVRSELFNLKLNFVHCVLPLKIETSCFISRLIIKRSKFGFYVLKFLIAFEYSSYFVTTEHVFGPLDFSRRDLAVLNIQRARDHGLPGYNEVREAYGLDAKTNWTDINPAIASVSMFATQNANHKLNNN